MVHGHAGTLGLDSLATWAHQASLNQSPKKSDQDKLDAVICALVGQIWRAKPRTESIMVGDVQNGYMIGPASPEVRARYAPPRLFTE
jgi:predicted RNase H-like nuclease